MPLNLEKKKVGAILDLFQQLSQEGKKEAIRLILENTNTLGSHEMEIEL